MTSRRQFLATTTAYLLAGTAHSVPSCDSAKTLSVWVSPRSCPSPTSVVLWTRIAPSPLRAGFRRPTRRNNPSDVGNRRTDDRFKRIVKRGTLNATAQVGPLRPRRTPRPRTRPRLLVPIYSRRRTEPRRSHAHRAQAQFADGKSESSRGLLPAIRAAARGGGRRLRTNSIRGAQPIPTCCSQTVNTAVICASVCHTNVSTRPSLRSIQKKKRTPMRACFANLSSKPVGPVPSKRKSRNKSVTRHPNNGARERRHDEEKGVPFSQRHPA